jgi:WD40 repeat protein
MVLVGAVGYREYTRVRAMHQAHDVVNQATTKENSRPQDPRILRAIFCRNAPLRLSFKPDSRLLAVITSRSRLIEIFDASDASLVRSFSQPESCVIGYSRDGQRLALGNSEGEIQIFASEGGPAIRQLDIKGKWARLAFHPDGKRLVTGSWEPEVRMWDMDSGKELWSTPAHERGVCQLAVSSDGRRVFSAGVDQTARAFDADSGKELRVFRGHRQQVWCLAVSRDGKRLATGSSDGTVRLWDTDTGQELWSAELKGGFENYVGGRPQYAVPGITFNPSEKLIVAAGNDHALHFYEAETGTDLYRLASPTQWKQGRGTQGIGISAVAYSPDGQLIATASQDEVVRIWDAVAIEKEVERRGNGSGSSRN